MAPAKTEVPAQFRCARLIFQALNLRALGSRFCFIVSAMQEDIRTEVIGKPVILWSQHSPSFQEATILCVN
jgi:hypothetical protein